MRPQTVRVPTMRLYDVLELQMNSTPDDIRRQYRSLALRYHPDKAGPAGEAKFKAISEAYSILSDPKKRRIYDQHGEKGLEYLNNPFAGVFVSNLEAHVLITILSAVLLFATVLLVLFSSFLAAKIDRKIDWRWAAVMSPIWIWDVIWGLLVLYALVQLCANLFSRGEEDAPESVRVRAMQFVSVAINICLLVFTILIGVGLEKGSLSWIVVFLPFYVGDGLRFVLSLPNMLPAVQRKRLESIPELAEVASPMIINTICVCQFFFDIWPLVTGILVAQRVEGNISTNWNVIAIPHFLSLIASVVHAIIFAYLRTSVDPEQKGATISGVIQQVIGIGMWLIAVLMTLAKIQGTSTKSLGTCFVPLFILEGFMFLGALVMLCASSKQASDELQMEEELEEVRRAQARQQQREDESIPNFTTGLPALPEREHSPA